MVKYIYDDKNGLWYELQGDYYISCLTHLRIADLRQGEIFAAFFIIAIDKPYCKLYNHFI